MRVDSCIRYEIYESQKHKRLPLTNIWKGISFDEIDRMNIPQESWKKHIYPYCGWETFKPGKAKKIDTVTKTRGQLINWYNERGFPIPPKSSCIFCPYQSELSWYDLQVNEPEDFEAACLVDEAMRDSSKKGVTQPIYLHESCVPLRSITFSPQGSDLFSGDCSGTCHN